MNNAYTFNSQEIKLIKTLRNAYYMPPVLSRIDAILATEEPSIYKDAFNHLHDIIQNSKEDVQNLIEQRKQSGLIQDTKQASKSVVGNIFSNSLIYIFLENKKIGNIEEHICITDKKSTVRGFEEISTINLGDGEQQKPDCDLIIYSYNINSPFSNENDSYPKCVILSLKTSLRERAAQTYKWKLLLEIANDKGSKVREKYGITYDIPEIPLICFVTVNFYNEINSPQQRGMLKFFDKAFLAKKVNKEIQENIEIINQEQNTEINQPKPKDFISPLSDIVDFVNDFFSLSE